MSIPMEADAAWTDISASGLQLDPAGLCDCDVATAARIARWIEDEADLLDRGAYRDWFALWEEDGHYWIPTEIGQTSPHKTLSLVWDDRPAIGRRVERMAGTLAFALQYPAAEVSRVISSVRVANSEASLLVSRSRFVLVQSRRGRSTVLGGRLLHVVRPRDGGYRLVLKRVDLVGADSPLDNFVTIL